MVTKLVLAAVGLSVSTLATASLTDGLAAYYPFDNSYLDISGNGNNMSATSGVTFVAGALGTAAQLNGTTGYIRAGNSSIGNLTTNGTITFWFNPTAINFVNGSRIFEKDDRAYWWFALDSRGLAVRIHGENSYQGPGWDLIGGSPQTLTGAWTAVALRKSGSVFDLFVNGVKADTANTTISTIITTAPLNFGSSYFWNTGYYTGAVDEARVYSRALSDLEVGQLAAVPEPAAWLLLIAGLPILIGSMVSNRAGAA